MSASKASNEFMDSLKASLKETGRKIDVDLEEVRVYAASQMTQLALAVGEPGYDRAVIAARDNVAMKAGLLAVAHADAIDSRIVGVIQGSLFVGARILAGGL